MRAFAQKAVNSALRPLGFEMRVKPEFRLPFPEATPEDIALVRKYARHTMSGQLRQWTLLQALRHIDRLGLPGDIVECGVWRGGNMMLAKDVNQHADTPRMIWLYDTFTGMSEPTDHDVMFSGRDALPEFRKAQRDGYTDWCYSSIEDVRTSFESFGLLDDNVRFIQGKVEDTLTVPENLPGQISLLRLDTDFYESTKVEMELLYPRLVSGGVFILDDYGTWKGAKTAVDEYFAGNPPLLCPVDKGCRMAIKQG